MFDHEQDCQPYLVDPYFCYMFVTMHACASAKPHAVTQQLSAAFLCLVCLFLFVSLEMSLFPSIFVPLLPFCLGIKSTSLVSPLPHGFFLPCDRGLDF